MFGFLFRGSSNFVRIPLPAKGKLYVSPMPYGPYDTANQLLRTYRKARIKAVIPLVTEKEIEQKAKRNLFKAYTKAGIEILHYPVPDLTSPKREDVVAAVEALEQHLVVDGTNVAVHCNAGIGRTGVIVSCVVQRLLQLPVQEIADYLRQYMMIDMTDEQRRFVAAWCADYGK